MKRQSWAAKRYARSRTRSGSGRCSRSPSPPESAFWREWPTAAIERAVMSLQATFTHAIQGVVGRVVRDAIAYGICAVCAIAIVILATWAAVLALIPLVGVVYAPLIVAGG